MFMVDVLTIKIEGIELSNFAYLDNPGVIYYEKKGVKR